MKVREAIDRIDGLKHNTYTDGEKIGWLSLIDGIIKDQIIDTHEDGDEITFNGYTDEDMETEMLVPAPYDVLYLRWLEAQIDYSNGEYDKYNNAIIMYQTSYDAFANHYRRTHMPKTAAFKYF